MVEIDALVCMLYDRFPNMEQGKVFYQSTVQMRPSHPLNERIDRKIYCRELWRNGIYLCQHMHAHNRLPNMVESKGATKYYSYYHCVGNCKICFRANQVNNLFSAELKKYISRKEMEEVYQMILAEERNNQTGHLHTGKKELIAKIKELEDKISYIRYLLSSRKIEPEDFREMKSDYACKK